MLLVKREKTLASVFMIRSDRLEGCGEDGGVVSDEVALSLKYIKYRNNNKCGNIKLNGVKVEKPHQIFYF